jgi:hypothetical protein
MKNLNKYLVIVPMVAAVIVMGLSNCTKHDQVLDLTTTTPTPVLNTDTLYSVNGTANLNPIGGAAWDGTIEGAWANAPALTVHAVVPDLGNNTFTGFIGNATDIKMRSLYDASNIYFLMEFNTDMKCVQSAQWYFNPTTKQWAQEKTVDDLTNLNPDGSYRPAFAQDQFVIMFDISCPTFSTMSCYAACHVMSSFGGTTTPDGGAMYTNGPTQRLDVWRARTMQAVPMNQANDCFIDDGASIGLGSSGQLDKNQVHGDWQVLNGATSSVPPSLQSPKVNVASPGATPVYAADGGFSNKQSMKITGKATKVNIPIWVYPNGNYSNSAILISDTASGTAVKVVAVDSNGVLTLANATTIDPSVGTDYKQIGTGDGPKCIPGSIIGAYTGSRGDVTVNAYYTGTGWRMLFQRALTTTDAANDADFASLKDQPFGVGAMFNRADNQHAIVAGLTLHFGKRGSIAHPENSNSISRHQNSSAIGK